MWTTATLVCCPSHCQVVSEPARRPAAALVHQSCVPGVHTAALRCREAYLPLGGPILPHLLLRASTDLAFFQENAAMMAARDQRAWNRSVPPLLCQRDVPTRCPSGHLSTGHASGHGALDWDQGPIVQLSSTRTANSGVVSAHRHVSARRMIITWAQSRYICFASRPPSVSRTEGLRHGLAGPRPLRGPTQWRLVKHSQGARNAEGSTFLR